MVHHLNKARFNSSLFNSEGYCKKGFAVYLRVLYGPSCPDINITFKLRKENLIKGGAVVSSATVWVIKQVETGAYLFLSSITIMHFIAISVIYCIIVSDFGLHFCITSYFLHRSSWMRSLNIYNIYTWDLVDFVRLCALYTWLLGAPIKPLSLALSAICPVFTIKVK